MEALQVVESPIPPVKACNDGAGGAIFFQVGTCARKTHRLPTNLQQCVTRRN